MDCSTPSFPVHHQLLELVKTHLHRVGDAIQPSLLSLLLLPSIFTSIRVFSNESVLHIRWPKYWSFSFSISLSSEYLGLISFRIDWFDLLCSPRDSQESSPAPQFSLVAQLFLTICDPMDCNTSGFPVHHQLLELAQTHVHWVSDVIKPSHPLLSPSPPVFDLSQHQGLF